MNPTNPDTTRPRSRACHIIPTDWATSPPPRTLYPRNSYHTTHTDQALTHRCLPPVVKHEIRTDSPYHTRIYTISTRCQAQSQAVTHARGASPQCHQSAIFSVSRYRLRPYVERGRADCTGCRTRDAGAHKGIPASRSCSRTVVTDVPPSNQYTVHHSPPRLAPTIWTGKEPTLLVCIISHKYSDIAQYLTMECQ